MEIFAHKRSRYARERIAQLKDRAARGGRRTQELAAIKRAGREIGPRRTPKGEWLRFECRGDRFGNFVRIDVYRSVKRANQRDVVIDSTEGVWLVEGISEGEIAARRFDQTKHLREIEED